MTRSNSIRSRFKASHRPNLRPSYLLHLEALEDRSLPSVSVLSLANGVSPSATASGQSEVTPIHGVSDDGRYTVFVSTATNLIANQAASATAATINVYLYDQTSGTVSLVSRSASATTANASSFNPVISGDGSTVVFYSGATNLGATTQGGASVSVTAGTVQLYSYSVASGRLSLVSHSSSSSSLGSDGTNPGIPSNAAVAGSFVNTLAYSVGSAALGQDIMGLALPSVSSDGKDIAFVSDADNLGATSTGGSDGAGGTYTNVFYYDQTTDTNTLVSHRNGNTTTSASGFASTAALSADGSTVAFTDPAADLTTSTSSTLGVSDQLYVWKKATNLSVLASHSASDPTAGATIPTSLQGGFLAELEGFTGWTADTPPSLSSDGNVVAYYDAGNNLVTGQAGTASVLNVFRYDATTNTNELVSHAYGSTTTAGNNPQNQVAPVDLGPVEATPPAISADGSIIAFANNSNNLLSTTLPTSNHNRDNVYLYDESTQQLTLVSHADGSSTTPDTNGGTAPSLSADGRYVAFIDWAYPTTGATSGTGTIRLYDRQASATVQPTALGGAFDLATSAAIDSGELVPTDISATVPTGNSVPVVVWDGTASAVVSGVTDTNANLDVFRAASVTTTTAPPTFTSSTANVTFTCNTTSTFTFTASGTPPPTYAITSGTVPPGLNFNTTTGVLSGTPTQGGSATLVITATNGGGSATQMLTLNVQRTPTTFTNASPPTTFAANTPITPFTFATQGFPAATFSLTGTLPPGLSLNTATGVLSGTPTQAGSYTFTIQASNGIGSPISQSYSVAIQQPAALVVSSTTPTLLAGTAASLTIDSTGYPTAVLTETGTLPTGLGFTANSDGTATLSGTPTQAGVFAFSIAASNGVGTPVTQNFTLTIDQTPTITNVNHATFTVGTLDPFAFTTNGFPTPTLSSSDLPSGLSLSSVGTLTGTPTAGAGVYAFHVTAANSVSSSTQTFTLTVVQSPAFTNVDNTTFRVGATNQFGFSATGYPTPTFTSSDLPSGLSLTASGSLTGTPVAGNGVYAFEVTATNGVGTPQVQDFTLTVDQSPAFTNVNNATFLVGTANQFAFTTSGYPSSVLSSTDLPSGVSLSSSGILTGTPNAGGGLYAFHVTAANGVSTDIQSFTLTVEDKPAITSAASAKFTVGAANQFAFTTTGYPSPSLTSADLPSGLSLTGTILGGTPSTGAGTYVFHVEAVNNVGSDTQTFTLSVAAAAKSGGSKAAVKTVGPIGTASIPISAPVTTVTSTASVTTSKVAVTPMATAKAVVTKTSPASTVSNAKAAQELAAATTATTTIPTATGLANNSVTTAKNAAPPAVPIAPVANVSVAILPIASINSPVLSSGSSTPVSQSGTPSNDNSTTDKVDEPEI